MQSQLLCFRSRFNSVLCRKSITVMEGRRFDTDASTVNLSPRPTCIITLHKTPYKPLKPLYSYLLLMLRMDMWAFINNSALVLSHQPLHLSLLLVNNLFRFNKEHRQLKQDTFFKSCEERMDSLLHLCCSCITFDMVEFL